MPFIESGKRRRAEKYLCEQCGKEFLRRRNSDKGKKPKRPTDDFITTFLANYPVEDFEENRPIMMTIIEKAWLYLPVEKAVAEFVYVSDELAEEMDSVTDALLEG